MAIVTEALPRTNHASVENTEAVSPCQFCLPYFIEKTRRVDVQLGSRPQILWKYLVTHAGALVLKYQQFLFEYSCAVVTARVFTEPLSVCLSLSGAKDNSSTDLDLEIQEATISEL
jgi:hypothetical protein